MRARCEKHALALGPGGCVICRREQGSALSPGTSSAVPAAAPPQEREAMITPVMSPELEQPRPSAPPRPPSTAPAPFLPVPAQRARIVPAGQGLPDLAPTAPATVSDAPEPPRLTINVRPIWFLPVAALGLVWLVAAVSSTPDAPSGDVSAVAAAPVELGAAAPAQGAPAEAGEGAEVHPAPDPDQSSEFTAAQIAELERARARALELDAARSRVKVTIYYTERCTRCAEARAFLRAQGVRAVERDIDKDARARARHRALNRKGGLPTLEIDGKVLMGFQEERVTKVLDKAANVRLARKR